MFSAWNFGQWLSSVGAATMIFGIIAVLSTLLSYTIVKILGEEGEVWQKTKTILLEAKTEAGPPSRRAA